MSQGLALCEDLRRWLLALTPRGARMGDARLVLVLTVWTGNPVVGFIGGAIFYHLWYWLAPRFSPRA
jgi:hypothetical protein